MRNGQQILVLLALMFERSKKDLAGMNNLPLPARSTLFCSTSAVFTESEGESIQLDKRHIASERRREHDRVSQTNTNIQESQ
jgi:hypothetical protein